MTEEWVVKITGKIEVELPFDEADLEWIAEAMHCRLIGYEN